MSETLPDEEEVMCYRCDTPCACGGWCIRNPKYVDHMDSQWACEKCGRPPSGHGSLCRTCGKEIDSWGDCRCGNSNDRLQVAVAQLSLNERRSGFKLEEAAVRYLSGDTSKGAAEALRTALDNWLQERDVDVNAIASRRPDGRANADVADRGEVRGGEPRATRRQQQAHAQQRSAHSKPRG